MADNNRRGAFALIAAGVALVAGSCWVDGAHAEDAVRRPPVGAQHARPRLAPRLRGVRTAAADRPLTIRRRAAVGPVGVAGGFYGDEYLVRQHSWNDPRLYYFGPFRTGGEVFYGDQAGNPITRGNAGLGQIAGYGPARGGYGGPHFDAVGGFHQGPGPDFKIDSDYASGNISTPSYGDIDPHYPSVAQRVAKLDTGVVPRTTGVTNASYDRAESRRVLAEGSASFEQAKADFAAPMRRQAPIEAAFANGGINAIGMGDDAF